MRRMDWYHMTISVHHGSIVFDLGGNTRIALPNALFVLACLTLGLVRLNLAYSLP